ncbi:MAG: ECF transporter S component [Desulfitobacteriaceae bacterium]|nr:ECF transporter S component [Desulfitobacteriaceae bacterium]MDI6879958.1 ECF transporter S component [Desulfitobacteriaceae bacterium]MDI6914793.1 ECF transporter S component [Desulfitobacteriaceae bacterium]
MSSMKLEKRESNMSVKTVKRLAIIAIFVALSAVGALIKIPSPVGTIGLDSAPGFFTALAFGGLEGVIVIALGHLLTAAVVGFPLSIPIHLFIALQMALWALSYRFVQRKFGLIAAVAVGILLNGVVSSFTMMLMGGLGAVLSVMPFLVLGSAINVILAALAYRGLKGSRLI